MISQRKIDANRRNAKKSTGPRTRNGKRSASRNALRHGLNAIQFRGGEMKEKATQIARMICASETDRLCFDQALIIAQNYLILARVRVTRARIMEHGGVQDRQSAPNHGARLPEALKQGEIEAVCSAFSELLALERYERRASSMRRRAIRTLGAFQQCKIGRYLTGPNLA